MEKELGILRLGMGTLSFQSGGSGTREAPLPVISAPYHLWKTGYASLKQTCLQIFLDKEQWQVTLHRNTRVPQENK